MAVDTATTIAGFDTTKPAGADSRTEADDNFRHIKTVLKTTYPNVNGVVSASHTEFNYVTGVTSALQTQLNAKAPIDSPTFTTSVTLPAVSSSDNSLKAATTAFVQTNIANVNAASGNLTRSTSSAASFSVSAGQMVAATNAGAVAVTFPASPSVGQVCGVWFDNGRIDNTIDLGANSVKGPNGNTISGVVTVDTLGPVVWAWYGDFWRAA